MAAAAPQSDWESLPTEISLSILKQLPDLTALYNYIISSPAAARVFDTYAAEIVEAHLASGAIHAYTCSIIRLAAYVRADIRPPSVSEWDDFNNLYVHETTEHRYDPPKWTNAPLRLVQQQQSGADGNAAAVSASVLRSVLSSHNRSEKLMIGCLATYLPRFRALQPLHLADQNFCWESNWPEPEETEIGGTWQLQPATVPFPKRDVGPPKWCEEQRLLRAAWRVQLFHDVKAAAAGDRFLEHWPELTINKLKRGDATCLMWVYSGDCIGEENYDRHFYKRNINVENELIFTLMDYIDALKEEANLSALKTDDVASLQCIPSRDWYVPVPSQRHIREVEWYTSAMAFYFQDVHGDEYCHIPGGWCTPLQHVPWDFYRRRGFAIWCEERMFGYGFVGRGHYYQDDDAAVTTYEEGRYSMDMTWMAWKSVLVEEELAEVDRINRRLQEEWMRPTPQRPQGIDYSYVERNITPDIYRKPCIQTTKQA